MDNITIAEWLTDYAHYLQARGGNLFRIRAYRRAAQTILGLDRPVAEVLAREGRKGLTALPGIGSHLSYTIQELVLTGEFRTFEEGHPRQPAPVDNPLEPCHAGHN
jgi:DNA polymerase/3'-5' exonuclease PolX